MLQIFKNQEDETTKTGWSVWLGFAITIGAAFLLCYTVTRPSPVSSSAIGLMIAGAASAAGIIVGFLFGIPRTVQQTRPQGAAGSDDDALSAYDVNTNLEQISDWLTKIIVGVGLVQLTKVPAKYQQLVDYLSTAFPDEPVPGALIGTAIAYFGIFAFLLGYLWTRLYLAREFSNAERNAREKPEFYEGVIHAFLYQPKPIGFTNAVKRAEEYRRRFGDGNKRVWTYLACAYGQQYSYLKADPKSDGKLMADVRTQALEAVRRVLQIDPKEKEFLQSLWDPQKAKFEEDDLTVFFDDQDFKDLLGG